MGFISRHIKPLVIIILRVDTQTHMYTHFMDKINCRKIINISLCSISANLTTVFGKANRNLFLASRNSIYAVKAAWTRPCISSVLFSKTLSHASTTQGSNDQNFVAYFLQNCDHIWLFRKILLHAYDDTDNPTTIYDYSGRLCHMHSMTMTIQ